MDTMTTRRIGTETVVEIVYYALSKL